jgi:trehalose utilization protein
MSISVLVWNEGRHEHSDPAVTAIYPEGIHGALAAPLRAAGMAVRTATLDDPGQGLSEETLAATDVLVWWGHRAHHELADAAMDLVQAHVLAGMGLIALHSSHYSRPFLRLLGTTGDLRHRQAGERERLWVVDPVHPIVEGLGPCIELEREEMYGEPFGVPTPDELVLVSWFQGGEVFRSGCCWRRGAGRIFYFRPGHETYPTYHHPDVQRVLVNAARWAAPARRHPRSKGRQEPREPLP